MTFDVDVGGRVRRVSVDAVDGAESAGGRFRVRLGAPVTTDAAADRGERVLEPVLEIDARVTDLGLLLADVATGRIVDVAVTERADGAMLIQLPRVALEATLVRGRGRAAGPATGGSGAQRITAPMPGRVLRVLVAPGQDVAARQGLVVIEAMKMENELTTLRAGRVREIAVVEGTSVEAGRLLLVVE